MKLLLATLAAIFLLSSEIRSQPVNFGARVLWHSGNTFTPQSLTADRRRLLLYGYSGTQASAVEVRSFPGGELVGVINAGPILDGSWTYQIVKGADLSADDATLVLTTNFRIECWDLKKNQLRWFQPLGSFTDVRIHQGSECIAAGNVIRAYSLSTGTQLRSIAGLSTPAFTRDASLVAGASGSDVLIYDVPTFSLVRSLNTGVTAINALEFSPDKTLLAVANNSLIKVYRVSDGVLRCTINGTSTPAGGLAFTQDNVQLASISAGNIRVWRTSNGLLLRSFPTSYEMIDLVDSDTKILASRTTSRAALYDFGSGLLVSELRFSAFSQRPVGISPNGRFTAGSSESGLATLDGWNGRVFANILNSSSQISVSNNNLVAFGDAGLPGVKLIDGSSGSLIHQWPDASYPSISADGSMIALQDPTGVKVLRTTDFTTMCVLPGGGDLSRFSPNGSLLALSRGSGQTDLFGLPSGALIRSIPLGSSGRGLAFSYDGSHLAIRGQLFRVSDASQVGGGNTGQADGAGVTSNGVRAIGGDGRILRTGAETVWLPDEVTHFQTSSDGVLVMYNGGVCFAPENARHIAVRAIYQDGSWSTRAVTGVLEVRSTVDGTLLQSSMVTLTEGGDFLVPCTFLPDYCDISFKGDRWLRKKLDNVLVDLHGAGPLLFFVTSGDADGDNEIGIGDYSMLSTSYGSTAGDPNWIETADLNLDDAVDIADYAILSQNYGQVGDD